MREYALIMRNMLEYTWVYINTQNSEYARILNESDGFHSFKVTVQMTEQLSRQQSIQKNTVKHLRWSVLQKEQCLSTCTQPEMSQSMEGFEELGHFDKHFIKTQEK